MSSIVVSTVCHWGWSHPRGKRRGEWAKTAQAEKRLRHGAFEPSRRKGARGGSTKGARPMDGLGKGAERLRAPQLRESVSEDEAGPPHIRPAGRVGGNASVFLAQLSGWARLSFRKGAQTEPMKADFRAGQTADESVHPRSVTNRGASRTRLAEGSRGRARNGGRSRSENSEREKKGKRGGRWWVTTSVPTHGTRNPRRPRRPRREH